MKTVWIIEIIDAAQENTPSGVMAVYATEAAANRYIAEYVIRRPQEQWQHDPSGFCGQWRNKNSLYLKLCERTVNE